MDSNEISHLSNMSHVSVFLCLSCRMGTTSIRNHRWTIWVVTSNHVDFEPHQHWPHHIIGDIFNRGINLQQFSIASFSQFENNSMGFIIVFVQSRAQMADKWFYFFLICVGTILTYRVVPRFSWFQLCCQPEFGSVQIGYIHLSAT